MPAAVVDRSIQVWNCASGTGGETLATGTPNAAARARAFAPRCAQGTASLESGSDAGGMELMVLSPSLICHSSSMSPSSSVRTWFPSSRRMPNSGAATCAGAPATATVGLQT